MLSCCVCCIAAAGQPADILEIEERVVIARRIHDVKRSNRFQGIAQGIMNVSQPDDQVRGSFCYILHIGIKKSAADDREAFCLVPEKSRVLPQCIVDGNGIKSQRGQNIFTNANQASNPRRLL